MISTLKKKLNKKGFTLAELLVVVAIIAILVAIAIPVFNSQMENARVSTDQANIRSAYSIAQTATLLQDTSSPLEDTAGNALVTTKTYVFQKDGSLLDKDATGTRNDYQIKGTTVSVDTVPAGPFVEADKIYVKWNDTKSAWEIKNSAT